MKKQGSKIGQWANVWTEQEDAVIRIIWTSGRRPKELSHMLPNRTPVAQRSRAKRLGFAHDYKNSPKTKQILSASYAAVLKILKISGKKTGRQLAGLTGYSLEGCQRAARALHDLELIHIAHWQRSRPDGPWIQEWEFGEGPDAVKPKRVLKSDSDRRCKLRRKLIQGEITPFDLMFSQLQAPRMKPLPHQAMDVIEAEGV